jgi:hypothetical protein
MTAPCLKCGGEVDHQPDLIRARERLGIGGGPKLCSACLWATCCDMPDADDETDAGAKRGSDEGG